MTVVDGRIKKKGETEILTNEKKINPKSLKVMFKQKRPIKSAFI